MYKIIVNNQGQDILSTNYWDSEHAKAGLLFLSWNAGAGRLLVPDTQLKFGGDCATTLAEMKTAKEVIISRGNYEGKDSLQLLFEDYSDTPFVVFMQIEQCDRTITEESGSFPFAVWTKAGKQLERQAQYRVVDELPCL